MNHDFDTLNSIHTYHFMDMDIKTSEFDFYCGSLKGQLINNSDIYSLCGQMVRNYEKIYRSLESDSHDNEKCKNLNYWLYHTVIQKYPHITEDKISSSDIIRKLHEAWKKYDFDDKCKFDMYKLKKTDFFYMKALYDYARDFDIIKSRVSLSSGKCFEDYYGYIEKGKNAYSYFNNKCSVEIEAVVDMSEVCKEFLYVKSIEKSPELSTLTCEKVGKSQLRKEGRGDAQHHLEEGNPRDHGDSHLQHEGEDALSSEVSSDFTLSHASLAIGFPLLVISLIFFILYKFTPLGSWLRSYLLRKNIHIYNMNGDVLQEFSSSTNEISSRNGMNNDHHISYHGI
ncbi:PIR protein [Plasmodium ovale]|uniref:PIR protein n=1 Tax=Plasmodium ovale TaxID=36330 RepID=A0A1D3JDH3_PLAOA|nr:PIR protein [Plasmodium ovale]